MEYLPLFFDLKQQPVIVIGGGDVAARKVSLLQRAQAVVTVVAPQLCESLAEQAAAGALQHVQAVFAASQLDGQTLVVAATDDLATNQAVSVAAKARGLPVNVVDQPELCSFIFPSILDRSPVVAAVSTGGSAPVLGRMLRARLETLIPAAYGELATLAREFRQPVKDTLTSMGARRRFWEQVLDGPVAEAVYAGKMDQARALMQVSLAQAVDDKLDRGEVFLVGAGPGDPDLLTFRALRLMQQADVVLYDRLVSEPILDLVRRDAERIYVGKKRDQHAVRQEGINQLLIDLAKQGKRVLRLKGGDPFIFGRGGEEISGLADEGIPFQVVPAVTAAAGCASYAGIPLTHRDYAQSVIFVTGQLKDGSVDLEWQTLVQPRQTVVVYMGLAGLEIICHQLQVHGMRSDMPAALVEQGTTPSQKVHTATISTLVESVAGKEVHAPTLLIIGDVVRLHGQLAWFKPDLGRG